MRRRRLTMVAVIACATLVGTGALAYSKFFAWRRFDTVAPGTLYRSGILRESQLEDAIARYGIKTIFSLTFTKHDEYDKICQEAGVRRYFAYLPGDGIGPKDPYLRFLQIVSDPAHQPVLVHCSAGVQRTGGAVALYRCVIEGWDFDRAIAEMIDKGNEGKSEQIALLRQIYDELSSSERCLVPIRKVAYKRRD